LSSSLLSFLFTMLLLPPRSTLFPYTTLFRSLEFKESFGVCYIIPFLANHPKMLRSCIFPLFKTQCAEVRILRPIPIHISHNIMRLKIFYECFKKFRQSAYYPVSCLVAKAHQFERSIIRCLIPHVPAATENSDRHKLSFIE